MHLLTKSHPNLRLSTAEEPPAKEANEAPDDDDDSHGDACNGARAETTFVGATAILYEVAENGALIIRWRSAARAVSDTLNATACLCTQLACFTGVQVTARWTGAALIGLIGHGACRTSRVTQWTHVRDSCQAIRTRLAFSIPSGRCADAFPGEPRRLVASALLDEVSGGAGRASTVSGSGAEPSPGRIACANAIERHVAPLALRAVLGTSNC